MRCSSLSMRWLMAASMAFCWSLMSAIRCTGGQLSVAVLTCYRRRQQHSAHQQLLISPVSHFLLEVALSLLFVPVLSGLPLKLPGNHPDANLQQTGHRQGPNSSCWTGTVQHHAALNTPCQRRASRQGHAPKMSDSEAILPADSSAFSSVIWPTNARVVLPS